MTMMNEGEQVTPESPVPTCQCDSANGACGCLNDSNQFQRGRRKLMQLEQAPAAPGRGRQTGRSRQVNRSRSLICKNLLKKDNMTQPVLTQWSDLFQRRRACSVDSP